MAEYRIYRLDNGGKFSPGTDVRCDDDKDACELARRMIARNQHAEVWSGVRLVRRVSGVSGAEMAEYGMVGRAQITVRRALSS